MAKLIRITRKWATQEVHLTVNCSQTLEQFYSTLSNEDSNNLIKTLDNGLDIFIKELMEIVKDRNNKRSKGLLVKPKEDIVIMKS